MGKILLLADKARKSGYYGMMNEMKYVLAWVTSPPTIHILLKDQKWILDLQSGEELNQAKN